MAMTFKDCYKDFIETFTDLSNWTDDNAKLIELCSDSADQDITLYEYSPYTTYT